MVSTLNYISSLSTKRPYSLKLHSWTRFAVFLFILLYMGFGVGSDQNAFGDQNSKSESKLASITTPKGSIIFAEIADSPDKRAQGLMDRLSIDQDRGMLFRFPELGYWTFWMKNTKIPLDILWLDKTGTIIHIESNVPICTRTDDQCPRYYSYKKSWQVLELKAGVAEKLELTPGSHLIISLPQNSTPY